MKKFLLQQLHHWLRYLLTYCMVKSSFDKEWNMTELTTSGKTLVSISVINILDKKNAGQLNHKAYFSFVN